MAGAVEPRTCGTVTQEERRLAHVRELGGAVKGGYDRTDMGDLFPPLFYL